MNKKEILKSRSNPTIKKIRSLHRRKTRAETGLFLAEGIRHVGAAIEAGWEIETLLYAPDLLRSEYARDLILASASKGIAAQPVAAALFRTLTEKENPQGILAAVKRRKRSLTELADSRHLAAIIAPQDPGNVGTILRTVDAVGADGLILLDGGADPYHPKAVRASMGTIFWQPPVRANFDEFLAWQKKMSLPLIGTSAHGDTLFSPSSFEKDAWILLLGSEQKGLSQAQISACDFIFSLPMHGRGSSLNLAVAAGVFLYALSENR